MDGPAAIARTDASKNEVSPSGAADQIQSSDHNCAWLLQSDLEPHDLSIGQTFVHTRPVCTSG